MIDPNKTYRTRDGRAVRIYATDAGGDCPVHGAIWADNRWHLLWWSGDGYHSMFAPHDFDLIEVTLADELRDQIPWEALRPEIQWVAMDRDYRWHGYRIRPHTECGEWDTDFDECRSIGEAIKMPNTSCHNWQETLIERPEDR